MFYIDASNNVMGNTPASRRRSRKAVAANTTNNNVGNANVEPIAEMVAETVEHPDVERKAPIAPYGYITEWQKEKGESIYVIVPKLAIEDKNQYLKRMVLFGIVLASPADRKLLNNYTEALRKDGMDIMTARVSALKDILSKMSVKVTYKFHAAGEVYTKQDGTKGTYEKDGYRADFDTIRLIRPKELADAWREGDYKEIFEKTSVEEDFE